MKNKAPVPPPSASTSDEQVAVRVAWKYFMEGKTQAEIAEELSTNRLRVNRIINEARRSGLVSITLNSRLSSCVELEAQLIEQFKLKRAIIVPTPEDGDIVSGLIGRATAEYVTQLLNTGEIKSLGIGWGLTLREMVRYMPSLRFPNLMVNSVMGGLTRGIEINTFNIASDLARQLDAECSYFAAPVYTSSPESRDAIVAQSVYRDALDRVVADDLVILSIGDMTPRSLLVRYGLPKDVSIHELVARGACGDIMAQFIDKRGEPIDHPINQRSIAHPLSSLRQIPNVVFAGGGLHKAPAIAAVLRSGLGTALVCDEDTARLALNLATAPTQGD